MSSPLSLWFWRDTPKDTCGVGMEVIACNRDVPYHGRHVYLRETVSVSAFRKLLLCGTVDLLATLSMRARQCRSIFPTLYHWSGIFEAKSLKHALWKQSFTNLQTILFWRVQSHTSQELSSNFAKAWLSKVLQKCRSPALSKHWRTKTLMIPVCVQISHSSQELPSGLPDVWQSPQPLGRSYRNITQIP